MAAIEHGIALARAHGASFDGALDESLEAGAVSLAGRRLVDLVVGKDSIEHEPLSAAMRAALEGFLDADGAVILSGEEIGYAMIEGAEAGASAAAAAFFLARFGAIYVEDDAETFELVGAGLFADALAETPARLDDGSSLYEVVFPDVWQPDPAKKSCCDSTADVPRWHRRRPSSPSARRCSAPGSRPSLTTMRAPPSWPLSSLTSCPG